MLLIVAGVLCGVVGLPQASDAANHYVNAGATGSGTGADWVNAWTQLPATLTRGDTYYIADGTYGSYTFDDPTSGTLFITVKKATIADHGTATGWQNAFGDGQAVLGSSLTVSTSYYVIDGNGTHSVPSNDTNSYGFKVASASSTLVQGIIRIGTSTAVSNVTLRYTHVYNTTNGSINNGTVSIRFYPSGSCTYIKIQNCFLENSGKDGIQISLSDYVLVERCYLRRLSRRASGSPDYHGQTVQMFVGTTDIVFRWNVFDGCEGQSLLAYGQNPTTTTARVRFYGNVVFSRYGTAETAGFSSSGGILGNAWVATEVTNIFVYNNSVVNQRASYTTTGNTATHFPIDSTNRSAVYGYNNLFYNSEPSSGQFTANSYNASGGYGTAGGTNEQTGLAATLFKNYQANDFTLAAATAPGLVLTSQSWWNAGANSFFGQLDSNLDMRGTVRGADGVWDRGAYEFGTAGAPKLLPPTGLTTIVP
jgi:hypothetical protein